MSRCPHELTLTHRLTLRKSAHVTPSQTLPSGEGFLSLRSEVPSIQAFTKRRAPASGTKTGFPGTRRTQRRNSMKELRPNPEKIIIFGGKLSENEKITTTSQHCSSTDELPGPPRLGEGGRQQICGPSGERARFPWPLFLGPGQTGARHLLLLHRTRSRPPSGKDIATK